MNKMTQVRTFITTYKFVIGIFLFNIFFCLLFLNNAFAQEKESLTIIGDQELSINYTDNISEEKVLIYSNQNTYTALGNTNIYFTTENTKDIELFNIGLGSLSKDFTVNSIKQFIANEEIEKDITKCHNEEINFNEKTATGTETMKIENCQTEKEIINNAITEKLDFTNEYEEILTEIKKDENKIFIANVSFKPNVKKFDIYALGVDGGLGLLDPILIYGENYDTYNVGDLNGQGTWAGSTDIDVNTTKYDTSPNSIRNNSNGDDAISISLTAITEDDTDNYEFEYKFLCNCVGAGCTTSWPENSFTLYSGTTELMWIRANCRSNNIQIMDNASWQTIGSSLTANTWYKIKLKWNWTADTYQASFNGGSYSSAYAFVGASVGSSFNKIELIFSNNQAEGSVYFDSILLNDNTEEEEPLPPPISTSTEYSLDSMPVYNLISVISNWGIIYDPITGSSTGYYLRYYHIPFFIWIIFAMVGLWLAGKIIIELVIRLRINK